MRVTHSHVIVDRHPVVEQFDDDEAGPDDRQRTAGRDASQASETRECRGNSTVTVAWAPMQFSAASAGVTQDAASCPCLVRFMLPARVRPTFPRLAASPASAVRLAALPATGGSIRVGGRARWEPRRGAVRLLGASSVRSRWATRLAILFGGTARRRRRPCAGILSPSTRSITARAEGAQHHASGARPPSLSY